MGVGEYAHPHHKTPAPYSLTLSGVLCLRPQRYRTGWRHPGAPRTDGTRATAPRPGLARRSDQHAHRWGTKASAWAVSFPAGRFGKGNGPDRPEILLSSPGPTSEYVRATPATDQRERAFGVLRLPWLDTPVVKKHRSSPRPEPRIRPGGSRERGPGRRVRFNSGCLDLSRHVPRRPSSPWDGALVEETTFPPPLASPGRNLPIVGSRFEQYARPRATRDYSPPRPQTHARPAPTSPRPRDRSHADWREELAQQHRAMFLPPPPRFPAEREMTHQCRPVSPLTVPGTPGV